MKVPSVSSSQSDALTVSSNFLDNFAKPSAINCSFIATGLSEFESTNCSLKGQSLEWLQRVQNSNIPGMQNSKTIGKS